MRHERYVKIIMTMKAQITVLECKPSVYELKKINYMNTEDKRLVS